CISAHLYRLGEGAAASPFALLGALVGFGLGFASWNTLYLSAIQSAPVAWLPHSLGYGGSALLQTALLGGIAWLLLRTHRPPETADDTQTASLSLTTLLTLRWSATTGGLLVALIAVLAYLRIAPLGVTAELGSIARTLAAGWSLLPERLEGLDSFAGCATAIKNTLLSPNGAFVLALIGGAWAAALAADQFRPQWPDWRAASRNFGGGILMGWGAMVALGCTVGTLLSGIMAAAVSGWIFALFCVAGAWLGWRLRVHVASRPRIG
ncbi:MAG: YeeE/YedE family protein, partial [Corticimicrobacter sp.]|uniref:YeeE/YedE family protein n=1 Tax=Corticimicrobacter sp. TaxID=2678536 RepID=UPI0032D9AF87